MKFMNQEKNNLIKLLTKMKKPRFFSFLQYLRDEALRAGEVNVVGRADLEEARGSDALAVLAEMGVVLRGAVGIDVSAEADNAEVLEQGAGVAAEERKKKERKRKNKDGQRKRELEFHFFFLLLLLLYFVVLSVDY